MNDQTESTKLARIEDRLDRKVAGNTLVATGHGVTFRDMNEVMEFAKLMSLGGIAVREHCRGNPGVCLAIVMQALEWNCSPFAVANKSFEVKNQLGFESQLVHAVIEARAPIKGRLRCRYEGEGQDLVCVVLGTFIGEDEPHEYKTPKLKDIPVKNSPLWKHDPEQQLWYFASRAWARKWCPDVLLGIYTPEELKYLPVGETSREYQRIVNPLGGNGDEVPDKILDEAITEGVSNLVDRTRAQEARTEPAGASEPESGGRQPSEQKVAPEPPAEAGNGKKRQTKKQQTRPDGGAAAEGNGRSAAPADANSSASDPPRPSDGAGPKWSLALPQPWQRCSSESYVNYALAWISDAPDKEKARARWDEERKIRNNIANPLDKAQHVACQEALGKVGS